MLNERIPKTIHYCWFSGEPVPAFLQSCMASWREVMPDYDIRLWDATSFDFDSVPFVHEAFRVKKWAFVADYVRLYALHEHGGIYLDSDVKVFKRFDKFLGYSFFSSHECHPLNFTDRERRKLDRNGTPIDKAQYIFGLNVQAAMMGGVKGSSFLGKCLDFYKDKHLLGEDGNALCDEFIIGPHISKIAEEFGYRYLLREQHLLDDMVILGPEVFVGNSAFLTKESYAIHLCNGSWKAKSRFERLKYGVRNHFPHAFPALVLSERVARNVWPPRVANCKGAFRALCRYLAG